MLKEAKKWVQDLEAMLTKLATEFNKSIEELDDAFTDWYDNGGSDFDLVGGPSSIEAFERNYKADHDDEAKQKAYDDIYQKMREFADRRDYTLSVKEAETIIDQCEEEGDSIFDCADGMLGR